MPETWIDSHHQHLVEIGQNLLEDTRRGRRISDYARAFPQSSDKLHGAMQIVVTFPMDENGVGTGFGKLVQKEVWVGNHKVCLQRKVRDPSERMNNRRSDRDVGDKMSVHHVNMNPVGACQIGLRYLRSQVRKSAARMDGASFTTSFRIVRACLFLTYRF